MITAVIIDDEKKSREVLKRLLAESGSSIEILGEANSVENGFEVINNVKPQLVFLDVEMLDGTGFNLLEKFDKIEFDVVFTTAYDKYAIKAFKYSALDYLLKPIDIEELEQAILKAEKSIVKKTDKHDQIQNLLNNLKKEVENNKIAITGASRVEFVNVCDIIYCQAEDSYTNIVLENERKITASKPLRHFNSMFENEPQFFRIDKSCLVNINYIKCYKKDKDAVELENGEELNIARRRKKDFLEKFKTI